MELLAESEQKLRLLDDKDLATGIRTSRAELTRHITWIHSHTLPILQHASGHPANLIVQMDIDALDDIIMQLMLFLDEDGQKDAVVPLLDHISSSVPLPGLSDRILSIKACWVDAKLDNADQARNLLKDVDPSRITDGPLLQAYTSIVGARSHLSRLELWARIVETSNRPIIRLQYTSLMALELSMMGEKGKARSLIDDALASSVPDDISNLDLYHVHWIARAHSFRWWITKDPQEVVQAHSYYDRIPTDQLNHRGKAALHAEIGMLHHDTGEYERAIEHYTLAYEYDPARAAICIYLSEAYLRSGQPERAREFLAKLDADALPDECRLEYWDVSGFLAIVDCDRDQFDMVLQALRSLQLEPQYFASVRDRLCLELSEAFGKREPLAQMSQHRGALGLLAKLRIVNQSVELKPNVFGIGLNLNKLIELCIGSDPE